MTTTLTATCTLPPPTSALKAPSSRSKGVGSGLRRAALRGVLPERVWRVGGDRYGFVVEDRDEMNMPQVPAN